MNTTTTKQKKPKFKVGDRVRLIPRSQIRGEARKIYLKHPGTVHGISYRTYDSRVGITHCLVSVGNLSATFAEDGAAFLYPLCLLRPVKPAKRKAKAKSSARRATRKDLNAA